MQSFSPVGNVFVTLLLARRRTLPRAVSTWLTMIIAFDAKRAFKNNTGLGNYSRTIIREFALTHPDDTLLLLTPDTRGRHSGFCADMPNVRIIVPHGIWRIFKSLWRTIGIGLRLLPEMPDVYHGLSQELPLIFTGRDAHKAGTRTVVSIHDMMPWRYPKNFHLIDRCIYRRKVKTACRHADRIIAISLQTKKDIVMFLSTDPSKIEVIYQSCEPQFRNTITAEQRAEVKKRYGLPEQYVICVGTIERRKNQDTLVRAMQSVASNVSLVIVGRKADLYPQVEATIHELALNDRVIILDSARFEDFPALYAGALAAVYISLFEGFGIPILEAMCCGTPVVTSRCSSMPEVGGEAALYADPTDIADIAEKINRLAHDSILRNNLITKGTEQAKHFLPDNATLKLDMLYKSVLPNH